jgi:acyl-CoA thioesterase FadM
MASRKKIVLLFSLSGMSGLNWTADGRVELGPFISTPFATPKEEVIRGAPKESLPDPNLDACYRALKKGLSSSVPFRFHVFTPVPDHFSQGPFIPQTLHLQLAISAIFRGIGTNPELETPFSQYQLTVDQLYFPLVRSFTRFHRPIAGDEEIFVEATAKSVNKDMSRILMEFALTDRHQKAFSSGFMMLGVIDELSGTRSLPEERRLIFFRPDGRPYVDDWPFSSQIRPTNDKDYLQLLSTPSRQAMEERLKSEGLEALEMRAIVPVYFNYKDGYDEVSSSMFLGLFQNALKHWRQNVGFPDKIFVDNNLKFTVVASSIQHINRLRQPEDVQVIFKVVAANADLSRMAIQFKVVSVDGLTNFATGFVVLDPEHTRLSREMLAVEKGTWTPSPGPLPDWAKPIFFKDVSNRK